MLKMECSVTLAAHPVQSSSLSRHISETAQTVPSLTSVLGPEARSLTALWGGMGVCPGIGNTCEAVGAARSRCGGCGLQWGDSERVLAGSPETPCWDDPVPGQSLLGRPEGTEQNNCTPLPGGI